MFRLPEKESRAYMAELGERLRPMDTAAFARRLLDRVARNHSIIVILQVTVAGTFPSFRSLLVTCASFSTESVESGHPSSAAVILLPACTQGGGLTQYQLPIFKKYPSLCLKHF